jgi:DNA-binding cell septation regulator SpoVG
MIEVVQGLPGIGFKIPECVVKVEKYMLILHPVNSALKMQTYYSFEQLRLNDQYECSYHRGQPGDRKGDR